MTLDGSKKPDSNLYNSLQSLFPVTIAMRHWVLVSPNENALESFPDEFLFVINITRMYRNDIGHRFLSLLTPPNKQAYLQYTVYLSTLF